MHNFTNSFNLWKKVSLGDSYYVDVESTETRNQIVLLSLLDPSKCFNVIDHPKLLKLQQHCAEDTAWFEVYLQNHTLSVSITGVSGNRQISTTLLKCPRIGKFGCKTTPYGYYFPLLPSYFDLDFPLSTTEQIESGATGINH